MTQPRKALVSLSETPYYHVISRCVRRAFLCGVDSYTGTSYEHRKSWVQERLQQLTECFAIELCAYAIMSSHYHLVLHLDDEKRKGWPATEVVRRWARLFQLPPMVLRWQRGEPLLDAEANVVGRLIDDWRTRLCDLSWFMRCLNEPLARRANQEDDCTGRFWEGRFKSQALLDETALLTCMAYVDLNPIRAGIAKTPETSPFTSIQARITTQTPRGLMPFQHAAQPPRTQAIPFAFPDYLELVDWSGRSIRADKRGAIPARLPSILERLAIPPEAWLQTLKRYPTHFRTAVGPLERFKARCERLQQRWLCGLGGIRLLYASVSPT